YCIVMRHGADLLSCPGTLADVQNRLESTPCALSRKSQPDSRGLVAGIHVFLTFDRIAFFMTMNIGMAPSQDVDARDMPGMTRIDQMAPPVFRFAPSPNGYLHLGHAYSALLNHDMAQAAGGRLLLRIEDIDTERCRPEYEAAICEDLRWLGISW